MEYAPIGIFVFNRPWHTLITLKALQLNEISNKSKIYIFSDGYIKNNKIQNNRIDEVRELIYNFNIGKEKEIIESPVNKGLRKSIIDGVSLMVQNHGKAIVLEDDIKVSTLFLDYMNSALDTFKNSNSVMHINGFSLPINYLNENIYFSSISFCWGWATWKRAWDKLIVDNNILKEQILENPKNRYHFDIEGNTNFSNQIEQNISGEINTWAVKWYASIFLNKGLCLHPNKSLVQNIGMDGTGIHFTKPNNKFKHAKENITEEIAVNKIPLIESKKARKAMRKYYKNSSNASFKRFIPIKVKNYIKNLINNTSSNKYKELENIERYKGVGIDLFEVKIKVPDVASFRFMYNEIFEKEIYKFYTSNEKPHIIDAGANIGLSIIYFKKLYPNAIIDAFEPDPYIFNILKSNIKNFRLDDVSLHNYGLWNNEREMDFYSEGADGGRIANSRDDKNIIKVKLKSLRPYLKEKIDFLKIDIEGSEDVVLEDIKDLLNNVDRIFVEYHSFINKKQTLNKIINILTKADFRIYINQVGVQSNNPFIRINSYNEMDLQLNISAFKI